MIYTDGYNIINTGISHENIFTYNNAGVVFNNMTFDNNKVETYNKSVVQFTRNVRISGPDSYSSSYNNSTIYVDYYFGTFWVYVDLFDSPSVYF